MKSTPMIIFKFWIRCRECDLHELSHGEAADDHKVLPNINVTAAARKCPCSVDQTEDFLDEIIEVKMGGTFGGILGVFLQALRTVVEQITDLALGSEGVPELWARCLGIRAASPRALHAGQGWGLHRHGHTAALRRGHEYNGGIVERERAV
ncbi:dihydroxyacetone kinase [Apiospora aurea]|uniref:Dihydroxyacetone kinase n=1 Tax=Apiospora aurea TaxID=335848 RepID=A0ABR1PT28_9PEZI